MKLQQFLEMTMTTGPMSSSDSSNLEKTMDWLLVKGKETGFVDKKKIVEFSQTNTLTLGVVNDDKVTSLVNGDFISIENVKYFQLRVRYSLAEYRNMGDISRLIWFIKYHLNHKVLFYGVQNSDSIKTIDNLANNPRFVVNWINVETGETVTYQSVDKRGLNKNEWRVLIESDDVKVHNLLERWGDTTMKVWYTLFESENIV